MWLTLPSSPPPTPRKEMPRNLEFNFLWFGMCREFRMNRICFFYIDVVIWSWNDHRARNDIKYTVSTPNRNIGSNALCGLMGRCDFHSIICFNWCKTITNCLLQGIKSQFSFNYSCYTNIKYLCFCKVLKTRT